MIRMRPSLKHINRLPSVFGACYHNERSKVDILRGYLTPKEVVSEKDNMIEEFGKKCEKLDKDLELMGERSFLRFQKPYTPPKNVENILKDLVKENFDNLEEASQLNLTDPRIKFKFLNACGESLKYFIPNSTLTDIKSYDDVVVFYKKPVLMETPIESLSTGQLPSNLHIITEPVRFHPDSDTMFDGISAFPKSSTIVTSIRTKKKYKGYKAEGVHPNFTLPHNFGLH